MNELAFTESPSLRAEHAGRVEVLDKVKALTLLPDGIHADLPMVARYFEVDIDAIESVVRRHRAELTENGLRALKGAEFREFASVNLTDANPGGARPPQTFLKEASSRAAVRARGNAEFARDRLSLANRGRTRAGQRHEKCRLNQTGFAQLYACGATGIMH